MPELPEVEAVRRRLESEVLGVEIISARVLRATITRPQRPSLIERGVAGRRIEAVRRRGKHLLVDLSGERVLDIHLRMTGNLYAVPDARLQPSTARISFELSDGRAVIFDDPRALGKVHIHSATEVEKLLAGKLGIEPLSSDFTVDALAEAARGSRQPIKLFLMDQRHVAGLGNIYVAEALFRARIHPAWPAGKLRRAKLRALHNAIVEILEDAVQSAYIAYSRPGDFGEAEGFPLGVYDREGEACGVCGRAIRRIRQGGRSTYYCPGCQRQRVLRNP